MPKVKRAPRPMPKEYLCRRCQQLTTAVDNNRMAVLKGLDNACHDAAWGTDFSRRDLPKLTSYIRLATPATTEA